MHLLREPGAESVLTLRSCSIGINRFDHNWFELIQSTFLNTLPTVNYWHAVTLWNSPYASYNHTALSCKSFFNCFDLVWGRLKMLINQTYWKRFFSNTTRKSQLAQIKNGLSQLTEHNLNHWLYKAVLLQQTLICISTFLTSFPRRDGVWSMRWFS